MRHHKIRLLVCAALLGIALGPARSQTAATLYGVADLAAYQKQLAGEAKVKLLQSGGMTTSRLGFAASEDLGGGLRGLVDISGFVRLDTGDSGRNATDPFWARNAFVGLSSANWGLLRLGRIPTATFISELGFGAFLDSTNLNPYVLHTFQPSGTQPMLTGNGALDSAWSNSVAYSLPTLANLPGLSASVQVAAGEGGTGGRRAGAGVTYRTGTFGISLTSDRVRDATLSVGAASSAVATAARPQYIATDVETYQGGAFYDFKVLRLGLQTSQTTFTNATANQIRLKTTAYSATVPAGSGSVLLQWVRTENRRSATPDTERKTLGLGYDYLLSKRTDLYAVALRDQVSGLNTGTGLALGVRHRF